MCLVVREFGAGVSDKLPTFETTTEGEKECAVCGNNRLHINSRYRNHWLCHSCIRVHQRHCFAILSGKGTLPHCSKDGKIFKQRKLYHR